MDDAEEEAGLLSIEEAAERLGIAPRTLRDALKRPEYAAGTVRIMRQTRSGQREAAMLTAALFERIARERGVNVAENVADVAAEPAENTAENAADVAAGTELRFHVPQVSNLGEQPPRDQAAPGVVGSVSRERDVVDSGNAALIEELRATIAAQREQLEAAAREREAAALERTRLLDLMQLSQENLGREQTLRREELRALPAVQQQEEQDRGNAIAPAAAGGPGSSAGAATNRARARLVVQV